MAVAYEGAQCRQWRKVRNVRADDRHPIKWRAARTLPAAEDTARQQRFGFGEVAAAYQDSLRTLRLASAEGAPFIGCATFLCDVELYTFNPAGPAGPGYYRDHDAPPPDPYEQSRAILAQAEPLPSHHAHAVT